MTESRMAHALRALDGCVTDLCAFADTPIGTGVAYDVARRLRMLSAELEAFDARDLMVTRRL